LNLLKWFPTEAVSNWCAQQVSLSISAEEVLEKTAQEKSEGDVIYFWAPMNMVQKDEEENERADFWSMCDILNAGHCR